MTEERGRWGRIADDGTVWVRTADGERAAGSWQAGSVEGGVAYYERRFEELLTEVELLERRLANGVADPQQVRASAGRLRASLETAAAFGDLASLDHRLVVLGDAAFARLAAVKAVRAQEAEQAVARKRALADEAGQLAASSDWMGAGDRLRAIAEEWRELRTDRKVDAELWKRFTTAREEFSRRRGAHFADLDRQRHVARERKEALVAEAEALAGSSDWGPAGARYRDLMAQWKAAGRAAKDADETLWQRFRVAQDLFFGRRAAEYGERDASQRENLATKEALLSEAEALDPDTDVQAAQRRLRDIHERWEKAGQVPRDAMGRLEERMAAAERRLRAAGDRRWERASESPFVDRLRRNVDELEERLRRARAAGRPTEPLEEQLTQQRTWLAQAERSGR